MRSIGLITYHHTTNFGSLLQTYALYKTVTQMGYNCKVIDYRNDAVKTVCALLTKLINSSTPFGRIAFIPSGTQP